MEIRYIKDYIEGFHKKSFPRIIERELKIKPIRRKCITLLGPRRAGKNLLLFLTYL